MQDNEDQKQKRCLVTEQTRFTDDDVRNSTQFEGENIALAQVDKVPTQAVSLIFSNCSLYSCKGLNFHVLVTHLDLSSNFLDSLPGLSGLNLEYVDLSGNLLTDVSTLSTCNQIQVLKLNNNQILKLDLVQNLPKLTELEFRNNQVQFLKPVITHQNFNVKWLSTQKQVLIQQLMELLKVSKEEAMQFQSEWEPWKYIASMLIRYRDKVINGSYNDWIASQNKPTENDILNRFGAEQLKEEIRILKKQFIEPNAIAEQKFKAKYENMIQLKTWITIFDVSENDSKKIVYIQNCERETFGRNVRISCDSKDSQTVLNKIKNINATFKVEVEEFRQLQIENDNELEDLSFVNEFNIQKLVVESCKNVTFYGVANVKVLHAYNCGIQSIEGIQNWNQLLELNLYNNKLESVAQLENLTQLKVLNLGLLPFSKNQIQNVEPLKGLVNLTNLDLSENQIQNVEPLRGLVNLTSLDLSSNQIENVEPLRGLVNLTTLSLSFNLIQNVEPLKGLVNLTNLNLQFNQIKDFSPIQNHPNFEKYEPQPQDL
ncbi:leucine-rich_repeat domain-containing protein [Hexamita inflata]|uniref:Leucine-rich repeat domain-containing protein n=1 Tax=Hexamita inflata TaxID=28002 RepID=A0AA86NKV4_9EUKA|nr:leucine-rich repeat domain-containing protein [Hexamita inflata]